MKTIYLDHAATSYPKPPSVIKAVQRFMTESGGNPGRGAHRLARQAAEIVYTCREEAAALFGAAPERVVFTSGATMSLNLAIRGLLRYGDHVLISSLSHNAVFRPLHALANTGEISMDIYPAGEDWERTVTALVTPRTRMLIATHASNICALTEPLEDIGKYCTKRGILFVVDGAQSGGHLPIQMETMGISALCLPGHKGLYGPQGVGMLILGENTPACIPLISGGSGSFSLDPFMPEDLPEHLEAGTLPVPAIAGLLEGIRFAMREGEGLHQEVESLGLLFTDEAQNLPGFHSYGKSGSVISFSIDGYSPAAIADFLDHQGICVRSGYHCAPIAHQYLGTPENGTVRISFGYGNRRSDVYRLLSCLRQIQV